MTQILSYETYNNLFEKIGFESEEIKDRIKYLFIDYLISSSPDKASHANLHMFLGMCEKLYLKENFDITQKENQELLKKHFCFILIEIGKNFSMNSIDKYLENVDNIDNKSLCVDLIKYSQNPDELKVTLIYNHTKRFPTGK